MTADLTIAQLAELSGVKAGTLRMWETRYGFPEPERTASGHRRYRRSDVELVQRVAAERDAGIALAVAIERSRVRDDEPDGSVFAALRRYRPDLDVHVLAKPAMRALSFAIEDECRAQAVRPVLYATFQTERFYRQSEQRWQDLSRTATEAFVFAEFPAVRKPRRGPHEIPLNGDSPVRREWSLICDSPDYSACLTGWERPSQDDLPDRMRSFEAIWTVEPEVVRYVALRLNRLARRADPDAADHAARYLEEPPPPIGPRQLRAAATLTSRMAAYLSETLG